MHVLLTAKDPLEVGAYVQVEHLPWIEILLRHYTGSIVVLNAGPRPNAADESDGHPQFTDFDPTTFTLYIGMEFWFQSEEEEEGVEMISPIQELLRIMHRKGCRILGDKEATIDQAQYIVSLTEQDEAVRLTSRDQLAKHLPEFLPKISD